MTVEQVRETCFVHIKTNEAFAREQVKFSANK